MTGELTLKHFQPEDVEDDLEARHRDAMLDLILAWGSLDGALGMMLARVVGVSLLEGAELFAKMPATARFAEMRRLMLKSPDGVDAAKMLKQHKKYYERHCQIRNLIAHSHCAGWWLKRPDYVVFLSYRVEGKDGLAVDCVNIHAMRKATAWADAMKKVAFQIANVPFEQDAGS
jgi:hypothetical protein